MKKFKIKTLCTKCNNDTFRLFDVITAKEKSVLELARKIASQGFVNTSQFKQQCTKCENFDVKLEYTEVLETNQ